LINFAVGLFFVQKNIRKRGNSMNLYRYMINDAERGGCVLAANEKEAEQKVRKMYEELIGSCDKWDAGEIAKYVITVWVSESIATADVVETYP
jgi:hypothetical protein